MKLTYILHSSFLLETEDCTMLFDHYRGNCPVIDAKKPLYIFVSHSHDDHYSKRIYAIAQDYLDADGVGVTFVLSKDVPVKHLSLDDARVASCRLKPHDKWKDDLLSVFTLKSNDLGLAFSIHVKNGAHFANIFFAGDLNAWNWDGDEEDMALIRIYHKELSLIKDMTYDLALLPLDPRLKENMMQGITDFFDVCGCNTMHIAPMHCWGDYAIIERAREAKDRYPYMERLLVIRREGDVFEL